MRIGFSGTRQGMTIPQTRSVREVLAKWKKITEAHHGDCIGADAVFHMMCLSRNVPIILHPAQGVGEKRAMCRGADKIRKCKPPLDRNHDIVREVDCMIIAPFQAEEVIRSGTWATWRYAKKAGKTIFLVLPDGSVT